MIEKLLTPARVFALLLVCAFGVIVHFPAVLTRLGILAPEQWFLDSYAILAANDAVAAGLPIRESNPLDPLGRPHVYSDWWLLLAKGGLTREHNFWFGAACVAWFASAAIATASPQRSAEVAWFFPVWVAPPSLLAVQRANNDLVIFGLLGVGLIGLQRTPSSVRVAVVSAGIVIGTGLKYYPVVALGALAAVLPWRRGVLGTVVASALVAAGLLYVSRDALPRGMLEMARTLYVFGAPIIWRDLELERVTAIILSLAVFSAAVAVVVSRGWTRGLADEAAPVGQRLLFAIGACVLIGCFLAGESHVYRLIFAIWLWPWLWRRRWTGDRAARVALALGIIAIWSDGVLCWVVNSLGLSYRPELGWRLLVQPIVWTWLILLGGWLVDGVWQRAREWRGTRPAGDATCPS